MRTPPAEPALVGLHPRDPGPMRQVPATATVTVTGPDGSVVSEFKPGDFEVVALDFPVGTVFTATVTVPDGPEPAQRSYRFRVTGSEADVSTHWVGPGLTTQRSRGVRRTYSGFEFGVLVMNAAPERSCAS